MSAERSAESPTTPAPSEEKKLRFFPNTRNIQETQQCLVDQVFAFSGAKKGRFGASFYCQDTSVPKGLDRFHPKPEYQLVGNIPFPPSSGAQDGVEKQLTDMSFNAEFSVSKEYQPEEFEFYSKLHDYTFERVILPNAEVIKPDLKGEEDQKFVKKSIGKFFKPALNPGKNNPTPERCVVRHKGNRQTQILRVTEIGPNNELRRADQWDVYKWREWCDQNEGYGFVAACKAEISHVYSSPERCALIFRPKVILLLKPYKVKKDENDGQDPTVPLVYQDPGIPGLVISDNRVDTTGIADEVANDHLSDVTADDGRLSELDDEQVVEKPAPKKRRKKSTKTKTKK